jgi:two-component system LytT family response regulator
MKLRVVIVDDEPLGRDRIRALLGSDSEVEVVGEAVDGEEAVELIGRVRPDLVFLDVQMPGLDGFGVLKRLGAPLPQVVFVTAFDSHAVKAFEAHALDYLLKPARPARLRDALTRAREQLGKRGTDDVSRRVLELLESRSTPSAHLTRIPVRSGERTLFLKVGLVDWFEAAGNYVVVHVGKENHVLRETLSGLEEQLPAQFLRISRSVIVNLERVRELQSMTAGEHVVLLQDGKTLPMTRGLREVEERLKFS